MAGKARAPKTTPQADEDQDDGGQDAASSKRRKDPGYRLARALAVEGNGSVAERLERWAQVETRDERRALFAGAQRRRGADGDEIDALWKKQEGIELSAGEAAAARVSTFMPAEAKALLALLKAKAGE